MTDTTTQTTGHRPPILPLATSRYQNWREELAEDHVAVGVTVGRPRFFRGPLNRMNVLAPHELFLPENKNLDHIPTETRIYRERLVRHRSEILDGFAELADLYPGKTAVLMCFEDVNGGAACHREWLSQWLREEFGWDVPELPTYPKNTRGAAIPRKAASRPAGPTQLFFFN